MRPHARKVAKARRKGKPDAARIIIHPAINLMRAADADARERQSGKTAGSKSHSKAAADRVMVQGYIKRDAEVRAEAGEGAGIGERFLDFSAKDPHEHDSDSESGIDSNEDTGYEPEKRPLRDC